MTYVSRGLVFAGVAAAVAFGVVYPRYTALKTHPPKENAGKLPAERLPVTGVKEMSQTPEKTHDYTIIAERNLFGLPPFDDKPKTPVVTEKPEDMQKARLSVVLVGTVSGTAGSSRAVIYDKSTGRQELYEVGDAIQGAVIKDILRGKVIVRLNGKNEVLDIADAAALRKRVVPGYTDFSGMHNKGMLPENPDSRMRVPGPDKINGVSGTRHSPARNSDKRPSMNSARTKKVMPSPTVRPPINQ